MKDDRYWAAGPLHDFFEASILRGLNQAGNDFSEPRGTAGRQARPLPVSGELGRRSPQQQPRTKVGEDLGPLQQALTGGAQCRGGSAPHRRRHPVEQVVAKRLPPALFAGPELLCPGLRSGAGRAASV
ncbi:hypothetical protein NDU88_001769 [Pleurodeles waltl]|uniref:Uncharacterized protein n=1 Tax=Pleurodeles waltl TaxID=8319 RepID=A0AAV7UB79_PLEWA|nr:hypothetical protein NDU88_001769 [Pleurodeles waltl]